MFELSNEVITFILIGLGILKVFEYLITILLYISLKKYRNLRGPRGPRGPPGKRGECNYNNNNDNNNQGNCNL